MAITVYLTTNLKKHPIKGVGVFQSQHNNCKNSKEIKNGESVSTLHVAWLRE